MCPMLQQSWSHHLRGHSDIASEIIYCKAYSKVSMWDFAMASVFALMPRPNAVSSVASKGDDDCVVKEVRLGRVVVPWMWEGTSEPVRVGPQKQRGGEVAPHNGLFLPRGLSINDRVEPELCSMNYPSVDVATK